MSAKAAAVIMLRPADRQTWESGSDGWPISPRLPLSHVECSSTIYNALGGESDVRWLELSEGE